VLLEYVEHKHSNTKTMTVSLLTKRLLSVNMLDKGMIRVPYKKKQDDTKFIALLRQIHNLKLMTHLGCWVVNNVNMCSRNYWFDVQVK
jgi:hypothetical protein